MSNFEDVESKYNFLLHKLDLLRGRGLADSDPEVIKTKVALRDLLELKKKNSTAIQKVVPRLTGFKTIAFKADTTLSAKPNIGEFLETVAKTEIFPNKYVILGVVIGISALLYYYFRPVDERR